MTACRAVALVNNVKLPCDVEAPHPGIAHTDAQREVVWCSDVEAIQAVTRESRGDPSRPKTEAEWDEWLAHNARRGLR